MKDDVRACRFQRGAQRIRVAQIDRENVAAFVVRAAARQNLVALPAKRIDEKATDKSAGSRNQRSHGKR
jgi:hypothetical protein